MVLPVFSDIVTNSHNSDLVSLTQQVSMWWKANIGASSLLLASLSEPVTCPSMSQCEGEQLLLFDLD